jgi:L-ascorbate metabolism protein UlaG (beta-lactamase superfamily)
MSNDSSLTVVQIDRRRVAPGHVCAWWLAGSGFVFKTPAGVRVYVDPYLSDVVKDIFDQSRAFPPVIAPEDARPDVCVSTHWHEDHLDPGTIPLIARNCPDARFVAPPTCLPRMSSWGIPRSRVTQLTIGKRFEFSDLTITATPARHDAGLAGHETPDAIGLILQAGGLKIYHAGDTEYDNRLRMMWRERFDVAMAPINGITGNMNAHEAALLCWQLGAKTVIPYHHQLWAETPGGEDATWDPNLFAQTYHRLGGTGRVILPEIGAEMEFGRSVRDVVDSPSP